MDTAKALALLGIQGGHMRDYKAPRVVTMARPTGWSTRDLQGLW
ncbi:hypothetical protein ACFV27_03645 [Streptomyces antimycoticus]|uniref:Uncharacterized protein n=1 Tax=Streptomyces antimycoticus TaxID=68175 RepID=A0ABD5JN82_9ACTN|nr:MULTISPECIES: hypothetical protein [Streptomyces]MEE4589895.1 hypothetical protein [Streptomyces sp. DSM 41602]WTB04614.1 hypothetical protein OG546_10515 [Streptomyces antimycoticus]